MLILELKDFENKFTLTHIMSKIFPEGKIQMVYPFFCNVRDFRFFLMLNKVVGYWSDIAWTYFLCNLT